MKKIYENRKPRKCPNCGYKIIANVLYGEPIFTDKLEAELAAGKTVIGGCCEISGGSPKWHCTHCNTDIFKEIE